MSKGETAIAGIIIVIAGGFFSAWVLVNLWIWFVVPLGMKSIGMAHAFGLTTFGALFLGSRGLRADLRASASDCNPLRTAFGWCFGFPAMSLLIGFVAHAFMPGVSQ